MIPKIREYDKSRRPHNQREPMLRNEAHLLTVRNYIDARAGVSGSGVKFAPRWRHLQRYKYEAE